jgi:cytochrome c oxidase subunit IV
MNLFLILLVIIISSVEFCGGWVIAPICGAMLKNRYHISTAATTSLVQRAPSFQFVGLHHCNDWLGRQCTAGHLARNRKNAHFYPNFRSTHVDLTQPVDQPPLLDHAAPGKTIENTVKRWKTGLLLALAGALWVCCSSKYFTIGFAGIAYLAHQEYVKMMHKMDIQPAILTSRIFSILFVASALWYPMLIPPLLTTSFLALVIAHLTRNDRKPLATDIFSSIFGTMYLGYLPSYWIILHGIKLPSQSFQLGKLLTVWTLMVVIAAGKC